MLSGPVVMRVLTESQWRARAADHRERVAAITGPHRERARRGESHPVLDFLFTYRSAEVRHAAWPLRLGSDGTDAVLESLPLRCTHHDAFRFFTADARPRNAPQPTRADQRALEQPGSAAARYGDGRRL